METNLGWLMNRAALNWRTVIDRYMAELGLTQTRWVALLVLDKVGEGCAQTVLASNVGVEQPSMVRTLGQLEAAGLIVRRASATDARCRTVWFTPAGKKLLIKIEKVVADRRELILKGIPKDHRQLLHGLLETVVSNAQSVLEQDRK